MDVLVLFLAATGTAVATGVGAIPVFLLGARAEELRPLLWGATVGMITVASFVGLLLPALDEGSPAEVLAGAAAGVAFLVGMRKFVSRPGGRLAHARPGGRVSALVFIVLFLHSLPEGFAIGTAFASERAGLSLFVIIAIALHNVPEGTSIAVPMSIAGYGRAQQFWAAVASSLPQPVGAVAAYLLVESVSGLLPASFGFAAGAMLALVAVELAPAAFTHGRLAGAVAGTVAGGAAMVLFALALSP